MKSKKKLIIFILLIVGLGFGYQMITQKGQQKPTNPPITISPRTLKEELTLSGKIDAHEHETLQFQTSGLLTWVGVKEGDVVRKYQPIASLDVRSIKKTIDKYLNSYMKERWDFEQTIDDNEGKIVSDKIKRILEQSQFDLDNSVRDVEIQDLARQLATISSPFDGIVTRVDAPYPGINITAVGAQFEVVNPTSLYFTVTADQTEVTKIKEGQIASLILDAFPRDIRNGIIHYISFVPTSDTTSATYKIDIDFSDDASQSAGIRLGMTGDATFLLAQKENVLAIPQINVYSDSKGKYVLRGKNKERTAVETGIESDGYIEVTSGLISGDVIYGRTR